MTGIDITAWLALGLVLFVTHRIGIRQGAEAQFKVSDKVVQKLHLDLLEAKEEADQNRFACELFKAALEQRDAQESKASDQDQPGKEL